MSDNKPKSFFRSFIGHDPNKIPELESTWNKIQRERPEEEGNVNLILPMNPITKLISGNPQARMWPGGIMEVNRDLINEADSSETIHHELGHAGQNFLRSVYDPYIKNEPWYKKFFNTSELESEAYNAEESARERERARKSTIRNASLVKK